MQHIWSRDSSGQEDPEVGRNLSRICTSVKWGLNCREQLGKVHCTCQSVCSKVDSSFMSIISFLATSPHAREMLLTRCLWNTSEVSLSMGVLTVIWGLVRSSGPWCANMRFTRSCSSCMPALCWCQTKAGLLHPEPEALLLTTVTCKHTCYSWVLVCWPVYGLCLVVRFVKHFLSLWLGWAS